MKNLLFLCLKKDKFVYYISMATKKVNTCESVERFQPSVEQGLTHEQVQMRIKQKMTNKTKMVVGKSYLEIIVSDIFNFFNIVLFIIAGLMIYGEYYSGLFFLCVLIPNIVLGLYQDLKARYLMGKLRIMTEPKSHVIRGGVKQEISSKDVVLDDIIFIETSAQIVADGVVRDGSLMVNESLVTGESNNIYKQKGDTVLSGSYVTSGRAYIQTMKVGSESYVETIQSKANKFKRTASEILKTLRQMFRVIGTIVILMGAAMVSVYAVQGSFNTQDGFKTAIGPISGSLVGMIPSGLYLLTSVALAVGVIALSQKQTLVQDFYSLEMLARTDVLCVDKTGTITDGDMAVQKIVSLQQVNLESIKQIISNILHATQDNNTTAKALKQEFDYELSVGVESALPFNSDNKYSGATFKGRGSYFIGAAEYLNLSNFNEIKGVLQEYTSRGYRVMVLAKGDLPIANHRAQGRLVALAIVVLSDHIRPSAAKTFKWFYDNNVSIRVISGDDAKTVSEVAKLAGIDSADKYVSLDHMNDEEIKEVASKYVVFGRVKPEQKQILIEAIHNSGHTVAMTGDGVNDILALKKADCSIAMASGSEAARNVSHLVLLDSNFDRLPSVVAEGRRVINNLQRTSSLFLCKTLFAMVISLVFLMASLIMNDASIRYPFFTNNLYLWEILGIGLTAFFIALEPSSDIIKDRFLTNILKKALPGGCLMIFSVLTVFLLYVLQMNNVLYVGIFTIDQAVGMSTIIMSLLCMVILYRICSPFSKYRLIVFLSALFIDILILLIFGFVYHNSEESNLLGIAFNQLSPLNYFTVAMIIICFCALYLFVGYLSDVIKLRKKGKTNDLHKS